MSWKIIIKSKDGNRVTCKADQDTACGIIASVLNIPRGEIETTELTVREECALDRENAQLLEARRLLAEQLEDASMREKELNETINRMRAKHDLVKESYLDVLRKDSRELDRIVEQYNNVADMRSNIIKLIEQQRKRWS